MRGFSCIYYIWLACNCWRDCIAMSVNVNHKHLWLGLWLKVSLMFETCMAVLEHTDKWMDKNTDRCDWNGHRQQQAFCISQKMMIVILSVQLYLWMRHENSLTERIYVLPDEGELTAEYLIMWFCFKTASSSAPEDVALLSIPCCSVVCNLKMVGNLCVI